MTSEYPAHVSSEGSELSMISIHLQCSASPMGGELASNFTLFSPPAQWVCVCVGGWVN